MTRMTCSKIGRAAAPLALALALFAAVPLAAQWPQWGGDGRDFRAQVEGLLASWPEGGPRLAWKRQLGDGESAVLVDGGVLYTTYRDDGDGSEVIVALDPADGATRWEYRYPAPIPDSFYLEHGDGPHATPAIAGDRICALGLTGKLHCLDKRTGELAWSRDLLRDHDGQPPACGYASSPLVVGDNLVVQVGGEGQGVVAFALTDGAVSWSGSDFAAGYAAPLLIDLEGQQQVVAFMRAEIAGIEPGTGKLLWSHPHPTQYGVNASTPIWGDDGILFVSSAYDQGSRGLRLTREEESTVVEELWFQKKLQVHFGNALRLGDHVYATSGDFGPAFLVAADVRSGEIAWQQRGVAAKGSLVQAGEAVVILDEKGKLVVATLTPQGVEVAAEHELVDGRVWAPPTLVGRRLYVRDRSHVYAFDVD